MLGVILSEGWCYSCSNVLARFDVEVGSPHDTVTRYRVPYEVACDLFKRPYSDLSSIERVCLAVECTAASGVP